MRNPSMRAPTLLSLDKCFIILLGLFCSAWVYFSSSSLRSLIMETESTMNSLKRSLDDSLQVRTKLSSFVSSRPAQQTINPYQKMLSFSYNESSMKELMSLTGLSEVPCTPNQVMCDLAKGHVIRAFNSWHHPRYLCGQKISPKSFLPIKESCPEGIRIFESEPTLHNIKIAPIKLLMHENLEMGKPQSYNCPVPCQLYGTPGNLQLLYVSGTNFVFEHSMESPMYYENLKIRPNAWRENRFYATTSFKSEVPLPYYSWAEYSIQKPAVRYDSSIKGASFIANNCDSLNNREDVVRTLMKMIRVDSLSSCLWNKDPPEGSSKADKKSMQNKYLLHFSFENSNEDDYITEKLWGAFGSGTLPVYMGAPNVQDHIPEHSIISWHDFPSTEALGEFLQQVLANQTLYESYHEWRTKPLPDKFHRRYDMTHVHSVCRTCKFVYAKERGWGWNSEKQEMEELKIPRKVCLNDKGAIIYPFLERDIDLETSPEYGLTQERLACKSSATIPAISTIANFQRTVWYHDGVIDIILEGNSTDVYQIKTPFHADFEALRKNLYQVQDMQSRLTVVGDPVLRMSSQSKGILDIQLSATKKDPQRVRIIVEDIDAFHQDAQSSQNYFAKMMIDEFVHPVQFVKLANDLESAN